MIKVKIIALGKLKEKYMASAADEYIKRLSRYCRLEIDELTPSAIPENATPAQISAALKNEAGEIMRRIPQNSYVIAMAIEGKMLTSEELSRKIDFAAIDGKSGVTFIIGSSYGLDPSVKQSADMRLSVSSMTFPHQLFRVMLLEQIYRAFKISEGGTYHK